MDDLRSWWEVPSIAHFCSLFRSAFDLTDFDIEDLEEALIESGREEGSEFILELLCKLLNGCYGRKDVSVANYDLYVKDIIKYKWEGIDSPIHEKNLFQELTLREKVELLHSVCEYRLDAEDVPELLKGFEGENMRVEPLGKDKDGSTYWYFYGSRLYKEDPEPKKEVTKAEKKAKEKKSRHELQKKKKEEKLKKKQDKKKEKAMKKRSAKKAKEDKAKKQETPDPNIRRSGRIQLKKTVVVEKDSESSDSSSTITSDESEEDSSTEEEEIEEVEKEEEEEPVKGRRGKKKTTPSKTKTPIKKGKQPKETSKSTTKKRGRNAQTPKQQKSEPAVSQSDSSIRRSSRIKCRKGRRPPPPKFDSDTEEDADNDDIDSGHESFESDDDNKSVKSEVSKYSTTSSVSKGPGRSRKGPMSKIDLNKQFTAAEEEEDGEKDVEDEEINKKDGKKKEEDEVKDSVQEDKLDKTEETDEATNEESADTSNQAMDDTSVNDKAQDGYSIQPESVAESTNKTDIEVNDQTVGEAKQGESLEETDQTHPTEILQPMEVETNGDLVSPRANSDEDGQNKTESMEIDESCETNINQKSTDGIDSLTVKDGDKTDIVSNENVNHADENLTLVSDGNEHGTIAENGDVAIHPEIESDAITEQVDSDNESKVACVEESSKDTTTVVKAEPIETEEDINGSDIKENKTDSIKEEAKPEISDDKSGIKDEKDNSNASVKEENNQDELNNKTGVEDEKKTEIVAGFTKLAKPLVPPPIASDTGKRWHLVCSTLDDWVNLAEWFKDSTVRCEKSLSKLITEDFLPVLPEIMEAREKERRKKLMELEVRRSERITVRQREKIESEKILAEALAEEEKAKLQAEEERRLKEEQQRLEDENRLREERVRAREERARRLSMREERARLLAEGKEIPPELIYTGTQKYKDDEDSDDSRCDLKDEEDYQNLMKVINAMKFHKDCWPFLEPVTDEQAPGYSDVIKRPMDISRIESKVEKKDYRSSSHFLSDFRLMFNNCKRFNGPESEFTECARNMERMLKKYIKRFMTEGPSDSYYEDKDFHVSNVRGGVGVEKRYRPKRAASSRALQTVHRALNDDEDYEESSSDDDESAPAPKKYREFPAKAVTGQSRLLQEMIELKRQREKKLSADALLNHQIISRGPKRVTVQSPSGGITIIPRDELPPTGVLKMAATREIKRRVDPSTFLNKVPDRKEGMSVYDKRRTTANPPKTIRIVAASNTLSGNASVKETAESVKVSSDGFLIIGGKNSGIKVSENTKIVIQPPAPGGTGQSPVSQAPVAGSKEIFIKKLPSQQQTAAADSTSPSPAAPKYVNNTSTVSNNPQDGASVKTPPAIITASSTSVPQRPGNQNPNVNSIQRPATIPNQDTTKPMSPDLQKKQVDIATRIMMLNQQKRKLMIQKQNHGPVSSSSSAKVIKLVQGSHQSIEDRLRDPAIEPDLGSVTKEVVSSVNIASDILDSYYSVLNKRTEDGTNASIPNIHSDNKLIASPAADSSSNPAVGAGQFVSLTNNSVISNGPVSATLNSAQLVTSQTPHPAVVPIATAAAGSVNVGSANNVGHSATVITNPTLQQTIVNQPVQQTVVGGVSINSIQQINLSSAKPEGPVTAVSVPSVLNSARIMTGGKVQVNVANMLHPQTPVGQVSLASYVVPTLGGNPGVVAAAAPSQSTDLYSQISSGPACVVSSQQMYTDNSVGLIGNTVVAPIDNTVAYTDNTVGPIEALFASHTGQPSVSFSTNPQTLTVPTAAAGVDISSSSPANSFSPNKTNRLNLFDMFETNSVSSVNVNSVSQPITNVIQTVGTDTLVEQQSSAGKLPGKTAVVNVPSSSTVNYGSPLKTMSIMEALKSKLNPQKLNQTSDSATPAVTQPNVPKCNLFPVACSAVDVDLDACFTPPFVDRYSAQLTASNDNPRPYTNSTNPANDLIAKLDNVISIKNACSKDGVYSSNAWSCTTDVNTEVNHGNQGYNCMETSQNKSLDAHINKSTNVSSNTESSHICERSPKPCKRLRDITKGTRIEIIYRIKDQTKTGSPSMKDVNTDVAKVKTVYGKGIETVDASTEINKLHCGPNIEVDRRPDAVTVILSSPDRNRQIEYEKEGPNMKYVEKGKTTPKRVQLPRISPHLGRYGHGRPGRNFGVKMWNSEEASGDQTPDKAKVTENFHLVQSWTELQKLKQSSKGKPVVGQPGYLDNKKIYFKLSDTVQRSSLSLPSDRPRKRRLKKYSSYETLRTGFGTKVYTSRSKSCTDASEPFQWTTDEYIVRKSASANTVSPTNDLEHVSVNGQRYSEHTEIDLKPLESMRQNQNGMSSGVTFVPKQNRKTNKACKQIQYNSNQNYVDLGLKTHGKDLSELRLDDRLERLSMKPVYTVQSLKHNSPGSSRCGKEPKMSPLYLRSCRSDSCVQDIQDFDFDLHQLETAKDSVDYPLAGTDIVQTALDSSLNCDKDFFSSELISNILPPYFGNGDSDIDPDLENIKDDIFELQDKYLLGHNMPQTSHVIPVTSVKQTVSPSRKTSSSIILPSSNNQPWNSLQGVSIASTTGIASMIKQTVIPSQVNIASNNPNQLTTVFPKHMSGTVVHITPTQPDVPTPEGLGTLQLHTNEEYS